MNQPLGKVHLFRASQIRMEQTLFNFICVRMQIRRYLSKKDLKPSKFSGGCRFQSNSILHSRVSTGLVVVSTFVIFDKRLD